MFFCRSLRRCCLLSIIAIQPLVISTFVVSPALNMIKQAKNASEENGVSDENHFCLQDIALATVSLRPVPFGPVMERISLTPENYGTIPRYYISTGEDRALTTAMQENLIELNPPNQVFRLKGSDHAPFFSKPQALYKVLVEIAQVYGKKELQ